MSSYMMAKALFPSFVYHSSPFYNFEEQTYSSHIILFIDILRDKMNTLGDDITKNS
ncbi:conserved domain protein [Paenibacillus sp. HGF5]|nr:conserved domain protein [Paenibacillus sp. HGF5]